MNTKKNNILLVDDNKNFLKVLRFQLLETAEGLINRIDEAYNGQEAIEMVEVNHYDLVFMDIDMPVMDGIEATKFLRQRYPNLMIVAISLYNNTEYIYTMLNAGADEYFLKDDLDEAGLMRIFNR